MTVDIESNQSTPEFDEFEAAGDVEIGDTDASEKEEKKPAAKRGPPKAAPAAKEPATKQADAVLQRQQENERTEAVQRHQAELLDKVDDLATKGSELFEDFQESVAEAQDWPKSGEFAKRFKMLLPAGTIPPDEMTPEMQAMQEQNQQLAAAEQQAKTNKMLADGANAEARARLAEAPAYKAVLDAHSRAADVTGKNVERDGSADDKQLRQALDLVGAHNDLEHEDRQHALAVEAQAHQHATGAVDLMAGLANEDRDFKLREDAQAAAQENPVTGGENL